MGIFCVLCHDQYSISKFICYIRMNKTTKKVSVALGVLFLLVGAFFAYSAFGPDISEGDIVSDLDPSVGVPYSGTWSFKLDIGNLGTAYVYADPDNNFVVLNADGQQVFFHNTSFVVPYTYRSYPKTIDESTAYFEFTAVDSDVIDGVVYHDQGAQSFHMELIDSDLPDNEWFELVDGDWVIDYGEIESDCSDEVASFSGLSSDMNVYSEYDLVTGEPTGDMAVEVGDVGFSVDAGENTNVYSQSSDPVDMGIPLNSDGDLLLDFEDDSFEAEFDFYGVNTNDVEGVVVITGSNGCSYTAGFAATSN
jgi:hypothetical protein